MKKLSFAVLLLLGLIGISSPVYSVIARADEDSLGERLRQEPLLLEVPPLKQGMVTSCGEAAIVMAYNYTHPDAPLAEKTVSAYAEAQGYFTPDKNPFTSPENMVKIARHYDGGISNGRVLTSNQGLALLDRRLQADTPVIIDVRTRLEDPQAAAHFVVVTGLSVMEAGQEGVIIHYNDPQTGAQETAPWEGEAGIWEAWQNNGDPGGSGWWMVIGE